MSIEQLIALKSVILLMAFGVFFTLERWRRVARPPEARGRLWRNAGLWAINLPVSPLVVVPITALAAGVGLWQRPDWWSGLPGLALDIVLLDLWIYWMHRSFHEVPFLWRFHSVHHFDEHLDTTTALRFHFGEIMISASVRSIFIIALAVPLSSVLLFEAAAMAVAIFQHSNAKLPGWLERGLSRVIVTPSIHWVHHHNIRQDTDSNYCNIFSWWDFLFGTRSKTTRTPDMPIGVEGVTSDRDFWGLITEPFRRR